MFTGYNVQLIGELRIGSKFSILRIPLDLEKAGCDPVFLRLGPMKLWT
jgi:hypothetical protein